MDEPAPTVASKARFHKWVTERPATTVSGTLRVGQPGHKCFKADCCGKGTTRQFGPGSVNLTLEEAAALQSFPPGYTFIGNKGERAQQIGNAIPPLLAAAILKSWAE